MIELKNDALTMFLFHGVVTKHDYEIRNYIRKHLDRDYFYSFLRNALDQGGKALSMDEVVHYYEEGKGYPPKSFAVTFDDGFENNLTVAAPILDNLNIPSIFYLTSGWIENNTMGWIDRLEYCFEETESVALLLPWNKESVYVSTPDEKIELLEQIRSRIKTSEEINSYDFVSDIFRQCGLNEPASGSGQLDKKISWDQINKLLENDLFSIGGHTVNHPVMAHLKDDDLEFEIGHNIEAILKHTSVEKITHFAYPEGLEYCYSDRVISALKNHGIKSSPTAISGYNGKNVELFHLNRFLVT